MYMCTLESCQIQDKIIRDIQGAAEITPTFRRAIYRVIQEESAILWEMIVCVILSKKVHTNMGPILNGYGVTTA
jgi:hypothetical protein